MKQNKPREDRGKAFWQREWYVQRLIDECELSTLSMAKQTVTKRWGEKKKQVGKGWSVGHTKCLVQSEELWEEFSREE